MAPRFWNIRKTLVTGALVAGATVGAAGIASAATGSSGTTSGSSGTSTPAGGSQTWTPGSAGMDPAAMTHGPGETLLTGTDLQKADAAASAAVPGATIIRAETDSSGATPYEVHMKKSDGNDVTVELSSSFQVVKTVSGFGAGPAGGHAPGGMPGDMTPPSGSTSTGSSTGAAA